MHLLNLEVTLVALTLGLRSINADGQLVATDKKALVGTIVNLPVKSTLCPDDGVMQTLFQGEIFCDPGSPGCEVQSEEVQGCQYLGHLFDVSECLWRQLCFPCFRNRTG